MKGLLESIFKDACSECTDSTTQCNGKDFAVKRRRERRKMNINIIIHPKNFIVVKRFSHNVVLNPNMNSHTICSPSIMYEGERKSIEKCAFVDKFIKADFK